MINVDARKLLSRLNRYCTAALEGAAGLCVNRGHFEVTPEHLLLKLAEDPAGDIQTVLSRLHVDASRLQRDLQRTVDRLRSDNSTRPVFSRSVFDWIQDSWLVASVELGLTEIRSGVLLACAVRQPERYGFEGNLPVLDEVPGEDLRKRLSELYAGSAEDLKTIPDETGSNASAASDASALKRFAHDITAQASEGKIDPVFCREREIQQMIDILGRRRKNNPILAGEAGVGKTAVVEGLALRIVQGKVPDFLRDVRIVGLDIGLLQAGAGVRGEFESRLKSVISEVKASPTPIVLFIDEAHTLIGAGGSAGTSDAANLLKPALARGELRTIAATTWSEYKKYFEKDAALERRFQLVSVGEPSEDETVIILRGLREKYESAHGVKILDEAVVAAAKMASRYLSGRQLPDKAVDLLDTAAARVRIRLTSRPDELEMLEQSIQAIERDVAACHGDRSCGLDVDEARVVTLEVQLAEAKDKFAASESRWQEQKRTVDELHGARGELQASPDHLRDITMLRLRGVKTVLKNLQGKDPLIHPDVDAEVVAKVVADWTGIPVGRVLRDEAESVLSLNRRMTGRVRGQDDAIEAIARVIRSSKAGLGNPAAPLGIFMLAGPSGVGKTETALSIADLLFGGERFVVTVNMSEFQEKHSVARLIGSPPGYMGYGEGGVLTEAVRQRPYSVVLLDEVEKADSEVLNLFYQVFDKGTLSDGEGRIIDFRNTVVFLTTNLGSETITRLGSRNDVTSEELAAAIRPEILRRFAPAFLGRLTLVPYKPIAADAMKEIVELKLKRLGDRLRQNHLLQFDYDIAVVEQIARRCTEVDTGARNVDHIVQHTILPKISLEILQRMSEGSLEGTLRLSLTESGDFSYHIETPAETALAV